MKDELYERTARDVLREERAPVKEEEAWKYVSGILLVIVILLLLFA